MHLALRRCMPVASLALAPRHPKAARIVLATVLGLVALNAFGGAYDGMAGAKGVPAEWLARTPFRSYFVPSLILFVFVGGSSLLGAIAVLGRSSLQLALASAAGLTMLGWIVIQVSIIGFVSFLQPLIAGAGVVVLSLTAYLRDDRACHR